MVYAPKIRLFSKIYLINAIFCLFKEEIEVCRHFLKNK